MKKILLASTILVGSAGVAAADNANFTFSGAAYAGVAYAANTTTTAFIPEVSAEFTVGMMSTTDMGLEVGSSITVSAASLGMDDDNTSTTFGILGTATTWESASSISDASVYMSGDFGKLAVAYDSNGSGNGASSTDWDVTMTYSNTWGDIAIEAYYTVAIDGPGGTNGDAGAQATYNFGDYSVYAGVDWDNSDPGWAVNFGGSATMSGFTASADVTWDNPAADWRWKVSGSYTTGAFTFGAFAEDDATGTNIDFGANGSYDLGGGASIDAAVIRDADSASWVAKAGVSMSF